MKPYKMPKNYLSWAKFQQHKDLVTLISPKQFDAFSMPSIYENLSYLYQLHSQGYPVYCLKESLLEDMLKTDVGENLALFSDINLAIPSYALFLPDGAIKSPTTRGTIDYLIVHHHEVNSLDHKHIISWGGVDSGDSSFFAAKRIRKDGTIKHSHFATDDKQQQDNSLTLRNIVLQSLLLMQYYPEIDQPMTVVPGKEKGFGKTSIPTNFLLPRWLGKEKSPSNNKGDGNGIGKCPHFRRGHWRKLENKITWVRPAWFHSDNSPKT